MKCDNHNKFILIASPAMSNFRPIGRSTGFLLPPSVTGNGYFSEANVSRCEAAKIVPLIS
jgi:hypothetical protein